MENPFKFGTIVQEEFFTDRKEEIGKIQQILESKNHLILISPRRFGKSSFDTQSYPNNRSTDNLHRFTIGYRYR